MKYLIGLGITSQCNMACQFCYSRHKRDNKDLPLEAWTSFFDRNNKQIGDINYGTGENTLSGDWFKLVNHLGMNYPHIKQALTTNGNLFLEIEKNREYAEIIKKYLREVDVSLDFGNKERHNAFRGNPAAYDSALNTLDFCNKNGLKPTMVTIGTDETIQTENLDSLFQIAKRYSAALRINVYRPVNKNAKINAPTLDQLITAFDWINEHHRIVAISDPLFKSIFTGEGNQTHTREDIVSIRILPNGNICPSTYLIDDEFAMGNICDENCLEKISHTEPFLRIKSLEIPKGCGDCEVKESCRGGCMDRRILYYGTPEERDPFCPVRNGTKGRIRSYSLSRDEGFSSIHEDYLPTLFFKPK